MLTVFIDTISIFRYSSFMNTIKKFFNDFGLNEKEQQVFFALTKLGSTGVIEISKSTGFRRTTTYYLLDQLESKGLVSYIQSGNRRTYTAVSPQRIKKILNEKKDEVDNQMYAFNHLLPEISMMYGQSQQKPKFTYYEGRLGAQEIFDDMLIDTKEIIVIGEVSTFEESVGEEYLEKFVEQRRAKGIHIRGIWVPSKMVSKYPASEEHLRTIRFAPDWVSAPVTTYIYNNKVAFTSSSGESFGTVIESVDLAKTMRNWFEMLWQASSEKIK